MKLHLIKKANFRNILGFIQGYLRYWTISMDRATQTYDMDWAEIEFDNHVKEQILYRMTVMNPVCIRKKECPCECVVPQKQFEDRSCENNCYPPMMSFENWLSYKVKNNITEKDFEEGVRIFKSITNKQTNK